MASRKSCHSNVSLSTEDESRDFEWKFHVSLYMDDPCLLCSNKRCRIFEVVVGSCLEATNFLDTMYLTVSVNN